MNLQDPNYPEKKEQFPNHKQWTTGITSDGRVYIQDDPAFLKFQKIRCWCHTCRPIDYRDPESVYMRLCPECGNKRCPKATNHELACTNSNDPGQEGSIY